jgi:hypothetical protein
MNSLKKGINRRITWDKDDISINTLRNSSDFILHQSLVVFCHTYGHEKTMFCINSDCIGNLSILEKNLTYSFIIS